MNKFIAAVIVLALGFGAYYWWSTQNGGDSETGDSTESSAVASGDAADGEESSSNSDYPTIAEAEASVVGEWESTEDANFTREFRADGSVVDRYEGDDAATVTGTWEVFTDTSTQPVTIPVIEGATYLRIVFGEETLYFTVPSVSADTLALVYLDGGALTFTRVQ